MKRPGNWNRWLADIALFNLGSVAYGLAVSVFTAPNDIAPGGVTGLATMLHYLGERYLSLELPIGMLILLFNLPLLAVAWLRLGHRLAVRTLLGTALSSIWVDVLAALLPPFHGEKMLVCLFGGALMGLGVGLIMTRGGTTGGTEIVARLLERRWPHISIGKLVLAVDGVVIALSAVVYGQLESPLYAVVLVFVSSLLTDWLVYGGRRGKMAMIVSQKQPELVQRLMQDLDRGATLLKAVGAYTGNEQNMILCAVRREEIYPLKRLVYQVDPDAFIMLLSTDEVLGSGWLRLQEEKE